MIKFMRNNKVATVILTVLRIFLGAGWIDAAIEKLFTDKPFSAAGFIAGGINQDPKSFIGLGAFVNEGYIGFLRIISGAPSSGKVTPDQLHTEFFNFVVPVGELLVGLGLIFGTFTIAATFFGLIMNLAYSYAGSVSVNPTYIVLSFILLMGGYNAAKIGLDYWVTPWLRKRLAFLNNDIPTRTVVKAEAQE